MLDINVLIKNKLKETKDNLIAKAKEDAIKNTIEAIKTRVKETLENERSKKYLAYFLFKVKLLQWLFPWPQKSSET